jgi:hypothetical protein
MDLATSWDSADVVTYELYRPDTPSMDFQTFLADERSNCSYAWGGRNSYNLPLPDPYKYWRLCIEENERAEWEEVDASSAIQLAQLTHASYSAFASSPEVGFMFGGVDHKEDGSTANARFYRSFNFKTKESKEHENPPYTSDGTLWGAKAVYVPDFGDHGLIFILGGMAQRGRSDDEYVGFEKLYFLDPVTGTWYTQTATSSERRFPHSRHQHCAAGLPGANGTYDM